MRMRALMYCSFSLFLLIVFRLTKQCELADEVCEFYLRVDQRMTMMHGRDKVYPQGGKLYRYNVTNTSATDVEVPLHTVISVDGYEFSRRVIVVNGSLPGPPIVVYEGQTVVVHVTNDLSSEGVTIHWHGLHQRGTPWMDGVAFITQCPILPGQTFTYRFTAEPRGTFWYHSHIGNQRTMGVLGALIIKERVIPNLIEHILLIQDWNNKWDSSMDDLKMVYGMYENRTKLSGTKSLEGALFSLFSFTSGLINGRGRFYNPHTGDHNGAPLETFRVEKNNTYRFRVIASGALYPFRISIDSHNITLVASDGYDIEPVTTDFFTINPGERFDFLLHADQAISNYWVRAQTLEIDYNHTAEAILRYNEAPEVDPISLGKKCSSASRCLDINCPFKFYPDDQYTDCLTFDQLRSKSENDTAPMTDGDTPLEEYFLNFAFPGDSWTPGSVNGRSFKFPEISALTQPAEVTSQCDKECGEQKVCRCSYGIELHDGDVVQMVFLNMGNGKGWAHPIHMHGHSFHVMKMGYPTYNETTGVILEDNLDVDCRGGTSRELSYCNNATWSNASWVGGNVPNMTLEGATRKDTIIVPTGGYVVVRIRADNPGLWFMHCHIELHAIDGMAIYLNESFSKYPATPEHFPECRSFTPASTSHYEGLSEPIHLNTDWLSKELFWMIIGVLGAIILLQLFLIIYCARARQKRSAKVDINPQKY
ncbi:hypothetical protein ScPMuIL_008439 [Solemya velum]